MSVKLSPLFNEASLDSSGNPWVGALLFTYTAGSSTKATVFQDSAGATPHANPIILNSRGEPPAPIWLTSGVTYKFVLTSPTDTDPPVSATRTVDNVSGTNDTTVTLDQWVAGPAPTFVGTTSFTLVGDQTSTFHVGRRLKTTNSGGTIYSTITVSAFTTLTTITVVNDSGVLDSGLSAISYGLLSTINPSTPLLTDTYPIVSGSADKTKKVRLEVDGLTTATTRVLTVQDSDHTLVGRDTTDTLTNKTLTSPTLTTPTLNGALAGDAIANAAETLTGTATDSILTPGGFAGNVDLTGAAGYYKFPGGLIVQWDTVTTDASGDATWTYPTAFGSVVFAVLGCVIQGDLSRVFNSDSPGLSSTGVHTTTSSTNAGIASTATVLAIGI